jgi:hypothetical protein
METTTLKCTVCEWIGSIPKRFCVNSGHSGNPIRYLCPECHKNSGKYSAVDFYRIIPKAEYNAISGPEYILEGSLLPYLLNCPTGMENRMINHDKLKWSKKHSRVDGFRFHSFFRKADVDAFIKTINGS